MWIASAAAHAQINTEQVLRIGQNALYFEDYVLSIQYFNQVIKAKPYLAEPYFFRSVAKIDLEDFQGAEEDASACIERNPFIVDAYQVRAVARQNQKKFALAIEDYDKGMELNPDNRSYIFNKGICQMELKQYAAADSSLNIARRLDPKNDRVFLAKAQIDLARKDTAQALAHIDSSLAISKNSEMAYGMRADIHIRHKATYPQAVADLDSLIKFQPRNAGNFINRAYLKYEIDDYMGAMADYDYAIGLEPNNMTAIYDRAQLSAEVGEDKKAIADFSKVLSLDPSNFLALYNRAQLYMRTHQYRRAVGDYDRILRKYPRFESGYMARAEAKRLAGDLKGGERDNEIAIGIFKQKGIKVSTYDPVKNEVRMAEKKIRQEQKDAQAKMDQPETEDDIIKKFNSILTVKNADSFKPEYANSSRGHIQNSNFDIDPEPMFYLSYYSYVNKLNGKTNYMKEVTEANDSHMLPMLLLLTNDNVKIDSTEINKRFASIEYYNGMLSTSRPRSIDYLARALDYMMVKNPEAALADVERAIKSSPKFVLAYFLRADAHYMQYQFEQKGGAGADAATPAGKNESQAAAMLHRREAGSQLDEVIADLKQVLSLSPKNVYALYNMGNAYMLEGKYTEAISCYTQAIDSKPDFGEAFYNRGLVYMRLGNRPSGMSDLSKAGELGILPSYTVLKRMQ